MAILAVRTQAFFVNVLLDVTGNARARGVPMLAIRFVTACAFRFEMPAKQLEIRRSMIERILVQTEDVGISTLVIRVAGCALVNPGSFGFAVKACCATEIVRYIIVTIETKCSLFRPVERLVAGRAF